MNWICFRGLLLIFIVSPLASVAQWSATVKGTVRSGEGYPISSVNIYCPSIQTGTTTDSNGYYELSLPSQDSLALRFTYVGYDTATYLVDIANESLIELNVVLNEIVRVLERVDVIDNRVSTQVSVLHLYPRTATTFPSPFGDFNRLLATLPGVISNNELSSSYNVRGGNFDENLVYINGHEVYRPFLIRTSIQEGLGLVNTDLVGSARFFAGGWQPRFGDKMSSALEVRYRTPVGFKGTVSAGLLGGSASLEGASSDKRFTYILGARNKRGRYLLNRLEIDGSFFPNYSDYQGFIKFQPIRKAPDRTEISVFTLYARNRFQVIPETRESEFGTFNQSLRFLVAFEGQDQLSYDIWQTGLGFRQMVSSRLIVTARLSGAKAFEREYGDVEGGYRLCDVDKNPGSSFFNECIAVRGIGTNFFHARNNLESTIVNGGVQLDLDLIGNKSIALGFNYSHQVFEDFLEEYEFVDSADFVSIKDRVIANSSTQAGVFSSFIQHHHPFASNFDLVYGLRLSQRNLNGQWLFSPRANVSWTAPGASTLILKAAAGLYQQHPVYREMRDFNGIVNVNTRAQQSAHFITGLEYDFPIWSRPFKWTTEIYYKLLWDIIPYDVDNVRIRYYGSNLGSGFSTGLDLRLSGEFIPGTESWVSMSFLSTREDVQGDNKGFIRRPGDQRFTLSAIFEDHLPSNPSLRVNLGLTYGSGLPFGPPDNFENRNTFVGGIYRRVDIGFSKEMLLSESRIDQTLRISLEILNLIGAENVISYTWIQDFSGTFIAVPNTLSNRFFNLKVRYSFGNRG